MTSADELGNARAALARWREGTLALESAITARPALETRFDRDLARLKASVREAEQRLQAAGEDEAAWEGLRQLMEDSGAAIDIALEELKSKLLGDPGDD